MTRRRADWGKRVETEIVNLLSLMKWEELDLGLIGQQGCTYPEKVWGQRQVIEKQQECSKGLWSRMCNILGLIAMLGWSAVRLRQPQGFSRSLTHRCLHQCCSWGATERGSCPCPIEWVKERAGATRGWAQVGMENAPQAEFWSES